MRNKEISGNTLISHLIIEKSVKMEILKILVIHNIPFLIEKYSVCKALN